MDVKARKSTSFPYSAYFAQIMRFAYGIVFFWVAAAGLNTGLAQDKEFTVDGSRTFDGRAFSYRIEKSEQLTDSVRFTLSFPSPMDTGDAQNDRITAIYDLPPDLADALNRGETYEKRPVVLIMHILDGNDALAEMMAQTIVKRGVATIRFKLPYYGERGGKRGPEILLENPELLAKALEQAMVDLRRVVDLAAARPEVNPDCIGISGVSLGAIVSATAVGAEPRLNRAMLILGGGDLHTILGYSVETAELRRLIDSLPESQRESLWKQLHRYDPLQAATRLRELAQNGRVRFITAEEDEVIPPICAQKLAQAMEIPADQWQTLPQQGHYTALRSLPVMLDQLGEFFAADLPEDLRTTRPEGGTNKTPRQALFTMLRQVSLFMTTLPMNGHCYRIELAASATIPSGRDGESEVLNGRFSLKLGATRRFRMEITLPQIPEASFYCGQNAESLWLYAVEHKVLYTAKLQTDETGATRSVDPLQTVDPEAWRRLQMVVGLAAGAGIAPNLLNQWVSFQEITTPRVSLLRMNAKEWPVEAILTLRPGTDTPEKIRVTASELTGKTTENSGNTKNDENIENGEVAGNGGEKPVRQTVIQINFDAWEPDAVEQPGQYDPPDAAQCHIVQTVTVDDLIRTLSAAANFGLMEYWP